MTPRQLRAALKRLQLSQSESARRLGVQQSTIYRWLAGERKIPGPVEAAVKCWLESRAPTGRDDPGSCENCAALALELGQIRMAGLPAPLPDWIGDEFLKEHERLLRVKFEAREGSPESIDTYKRGGKTMAEQVVDWWEREGRPKWLAAGLPAAPPEIQDEIAWLVEGQGDGRPVWWTGKWWPRFATIVHGPLHSTHAIPRSTDDMEPIFSPEHAEAIRFARKEDAERAIGLLPAFYRAAVKASEHMWGARTALGEGRVE